LDIQTAKAAFGYTGGKGRLWIYRRQRPPLDIQAAKAANILGLDDLQVLAAAARIPVSHDRETMPGYFREFIMRSDSEGLSIVSQTVEIREATEQILLIWASFGSQ